MHARIVEPGVLDGYKFVSGFIYKILNIEREEEFKSILYKNKLSLKNPIF